MYWKYADFLSICRTLIKFLAAILSTEKAEAIDHVLMIRQWIKCSMLCTTINEDLQNLTSAIAKLSTFQMMCNVPENEILAAKEPLSAFFAGVGKIYESSDVCGHVSCDYGTLYV